MFEEVVFVVDSYACTVSSWNKSGEEEGYIFHFLPALHSLPIWMTTDKETSRSVMHIFSFKPHSPFTVFHHSHEYETITHHHISKMVSGFTNNNNNKHHHHVGRRSPRSGSGSSSSSSSSSHSASSTIPNGSRPSAFRWLEVETFVTYQVRSFSSPSPSSGNDYSFGDGGGGGDNGDTERSTRLSTVLDILDEVLDLIESDSDLDYYQMIDATNPTTN